MKNHRLKIASNAQFTAAQAGGPSASAKLTELKLADAARWRAAQSSGSAGGAKRRKPVASAAGGAA
ncbi:hypothetical protein [Roseateles amylovorans]|uniref:Uncharacterized protein n=1 Tax=Roseateles amylovorans TaxID=2978473 RepID=A0ABY6AU22_9BURK|nr:hypothetical protein [Roseateles amylovorans]UXH76172.1 hypothetical protein N4261_13925 [Roseateles amylovorans]